MITRGHSAAVARGGYQPSRARPFSLSFVRSAPSALRLLGLRWTSASRAKHPPTRRRANQPPASRSRLFPPNSGARPELAEKTGKSRSASDPAAQHSGKRRRLRKRPPAPTPLALVEEVDVWRATLDPVRTRRGGGISRVTLAPVPCGRETLLGSDSGSGIRPTSRRMSCQPARS